MYTHFSVPAIKLCSNGAERKEVEDSQCQSDVIGDEI
jgi:hypothetical protein